MGVAVLCPRCKRETLPKQPGNHIPAHRGAHTHDKGDSLSPEAEKIRKRKERRARGKAIRELIRSGDILGAQRLAFTTAPLPAESINEDCDRCLKLIRDHVA